MFRTMNSCSSRADGKAAAPHAAMHTEKTYLPAQLQQTMKAATFLPVISGGIQALQTNQPFLGEVGPASLSTAACVVSLNPTALTRMLLS